ncbi:MAG TPA: urate hydroxylase PuuD, partial [Steroidobacteraceae bacterium]|nr:urate hydroxylase PuuD [Steroidobacteraceae bacterium]
ANLVNAFTFGHFGEDLYGLVIGTGAWLGTIMLFNVWVLINPNQMKVLGFTPATDEEKVRARRVALLASRTNFVLSIPMLMCMAGATHGLPY